MNSVVIVMPLEEFLLPNENVEFSTPTEILYGGEKFQCFLTNQRVMFFARRGIVFKRDHVISIALAEIIEMEYQERGLFKKGYIFIKSEKTNFSLQGNTETMKELTKLLQNKLETRKFEEKPTVIIKEKGIEKEIRKEVVMVPCKYCGGLMPQTSTFCPNCGAKRET